MPALHHFFLIGAAVPPVCRTAYSHVRLLVFPKVCVAWDKYLGEDGMQLFLTVLRAAL